MSTAVPALLRHLIDDAALYPPGNAPMPVAVAEHRRHRAAPYRDLVGPLLVPASRYDELAEHLADAPLELGLIGDRGVRHLLGVAERALADPRVRLARLECVVEDSGPLGARDAGLALDGVPDEITVYVELRRDDDVADGVRALADLPSRHAIGAKLRTGGSTAAAFPTDAELAGFVDICLAADHPFKLTAGLHRAVRHTDPATGFEYHGYLNVLVAVCLGALDRAYPTVEAALAERDPAPLVEAAQRMYGMPGEATESRTWFASYGSCSIAEPLGDLVALGLLDPTLRKSP